MDTLGVPSNVIEALLNHKRPKLELALQAIAKEYGARNIRCNIVLPGFLQTQMTAPLPEKRLEEVVRTRVRLLEALALFGDLVA